VDLGGVSVHFILSCFCRRGSFCSPLPLELPSRWTSPQSSFISLTTLSTTLGASSSPSLALVGHPSSDSTHLLIFTEFFGGLTDSYNFDLPLDSRAPWKDLAPTIWEWELTKSLNFGKLPVADYPGNAIFRRLSKFKQNNTFDTRFGNWCKCSTEHETIKMFLRLSYPIEAFDRRLRKFLYWFRHQRYMAPALWDEISWGLRILLHHNVLSPIDARNYPVHLTYPLSTQPTSIPLESDDEDEDDAEDQVSPTLFDSAERFKKYIFFLIQGSEGPMTSGEISKICKRETGLFPKQHMAHLAIHESLSDFISNNLFDKVETAVLEGVTSHSLRATPLVSTLPTTSSLIKDLSNSSHASEKSSTSTLQMQSSPEADPHSFQTTVKFASLEDYADYIFSVIEKTSPVRNDVISAACRVDTGVFPRHHFRYLGYEAHLTRFIRTYLPRRVFSRKCESGDWIHELMTSERRKSASLEPLERLSSDDPSESCVEVERKGLIIEAPGPDLEPRWTDPEKEEGLQKFKMYLYNIIRSFCGPITFAEINAQCLLDLNGDASSLLVELGYHDKFMIFIRTYLAGFVLCYHRDAQAFYIATPKIFPGFVPMKHLKTFALSTLTLFAEFVYSQVVALGGLNAPVSYHALDTRCVEIIGANLQDKLNSLEWRSPPSKFLATYPSWRLVVIVIDGVTCVRVKATSSQSSTDTRQPAVIIPPHLGRAFPNK
jgi:hypothetical protein